MVRGKGITILTEKSPHCGQYAYISGVSMNNLTSLEVSDTKELQCEHYEPDNFGDICHAGKEDECPNHGDCSAKYNVHEDLLLID